MNHKQWIAVLATTLGAFMAVLDIQITNASLNQISGGIAATVDEGSWISTAYLIGEIVTIGLTPWASKVFTVRWYLIGNVILFLGFSGLAGLAHSLGEMIAWRVGQGFTGGVLIPMCLTVISTTMPKNLQPVGQTMFGLTATLAPAVGPYVGGWLTDNIGWEWNFYLNFLPGVVMLAGIIYAVPAEKMHLSELKRGDYLGIASMAIGMGSLIAMLEEGQRKDWFGNEFIRNAGILAAIFIPVFIINELVVERPFVNLRLLASRNLAMGCVVAFVLGLALYGNLYLIPLYLSEVQNYSPFKIGEVLVWVGLPQLLIFPLLPLLMKRIDLRPLVCVGSIIFATSCFMSSFMSYDYAYDQFITSNVVRAFGQPFTIVPVTTLALATLAPKDASNGSALFNMLRNTGGSVGTALLDTIVTRREQFHDFRIGESVTAYSLSTQARLANQQGDYIARGYDSATAMNQAYKTIKQLMTREAYVMAFNDAFLVVGISLLVGATVVWFCKKLAPGAKAPAA